jgi:putative glutamine amidotransferase
MPPVIGIAPCRKLLDYVESVRRAGGEPRVLDPATDPVSQVLSSVDGLLLTGGGDVDPTHYHQPRHPSFAEAEPGRDDYEIALVREAVHRDVPLLAVCRGIQVLNVAQGGTLLQDVPSEVPGAVDHNVETSPFAIAHEVWMTNGSLLLNLMREAVPEGDACPVNSRHHQAVAHVASGFQVSATAPDGVIEAIERESSRFCLGVQWHPENFWRTGEFRPLFEGFVAACTRAR